MSLKGQAPALEEQRPFHTEDRWNKIYTSNKRDRFLQTTYYNDRREKHHGAQDVLFILGANGQMKKKTPNLLLQNLLLNESTRIGVHVL